MATGTRAPESVMPSDRKQINIRLDPEIEELLPRLLAAVSESMRLKLSQSDLIRLALLDMAAKYLPAGTPKKKSK